MLDPASFRPRLASAAGPEIVALVLTIVVVIGFVAVVGYGSLTARPGASPPLGSPGPSPSGAISAGSPAAAILEVEPGRAGLSLGWGGS